MARDDSRVVIVDSSVCKVWVEDWDVEIKSGSAAFLSLFDSRVSSRVVISASSVCKVWIWVWDVSMSPGMAAFLAV